jgi:hypothetical protein
VSLTTNTHQQFYYTKTSHPQVGTLNVAIEPPFIATNSSASLHGGWRLESDSVYREGGTKLELYAGSYVVVFRPVTNLWTAPSRRLVSVSGNWRGRSRGDIAGRVGRGPDVLDFVRVNGVSPAAIRMCVDNTVGRGLRDRLRGERVVTAARGVGVALVR